MKSFPLQLLLLAAIPISFSFMPGVRTDTAALPGLRVNRVILFRATPFEVRPGGALMLEGSGFSRTQNKVYFNNGDSTSAISSNGTTMKVLVPATLSPGEYHVSVSNIFGSSESPDLPILVRVTNSPEPAPFIQGASLSGDTITVFGTGFGSTNSVFTTLGDTSIPVSAQGGKLSFRLSDLSMYEKIKNSLPSGSHEVALWIYVKSEHGINKDPFKLNIAI